MTPAGLTGLALLIVLTLVVALLARRSRHGALGSSYPHSPWGADAAQDADLRRVLHDLDGHRDLPAGPRAA